MEYTVFQNRLQSNKQVQLHLHTHACKHRHTYTFYQTIFNKVKYGKEDTYSGSVNIYI